MGIERIIEGGTNDFEAAKRAKELFKHQYWNQFVAGVGIGSGTTGEYALTVYFDENSVAAQEFARSIPEYIENVPVNIIYTGKIMTC